MIRRVDFHGGPDRALGFLAIVFEDFILCVNGSSSAKNHTVSGDEQKPRQKAGRPEPGEGFDFFINEYAPGALGAQVHEYLDANPQHDQQDERYRVVLMYANGHPSAYAR